MQFITQKRRSLTEGSQRGNALESIEEMSAKSLRLAYNIREAQRRWTHYRGLLASKSSSLNCLEVRR